MSAPRWVVFLLVIPGLVVALLLMAVFFLALALFPPLVSTVALSIMGVFIIWLFMRKRSKGPVSEGSLVGRQSTKDGLL